MNKRVLVTGGCGFLGSNLVIELLRQGYTVDVFDDMSNGRLEFFVVENIQTKESYQSSATKHINLIFDKKEALKRVNFMRYDVVFHLAANPRPALSIEDPIKTYNDNVFLSLEFMDAIRTSQDHSTKFVFASSSAVYGEGSNVVMSESDVCIPVSPYGLEKLNVEQMMKLYSQYHELNFVALRFFNVYGKNQLASPKYPCVVAAWLKLMLSDKTVQINGSGKMSRDFVHVDDVVKAMISASKLNTRFDVFNVGSGTKYTLFELYDILSSIVGIEEKYSVFSSSRPGDVNSTLANIDNMKSKLGITPTSLDVGLKKTYDWAKDSWIFKNLNVNI